MLKKMLKKTAALALLPALTAVFTACTLFGGGETAPVTETAADAPETEINIRLEKCTASGTVGFDRIETGMFIWDGNSENALFPFELDGKYGYMNDRGEVVIEAKYGRAAPFSEGIAVVCDDEYSVWRVIDAEGAVLYTGGVYYEEIRNSAEPMRFSGCAAVLTFMSGDEANVITVRNGNRKTGGGFDINVRKFPADISNIHPVFTEDNVYFISENITPPEGGRIIVVDNKSGDSSEFGSAYFGFLGERYFVIKTKTYKYRIIDAVTGEPITDDIEQRAVSFSDGVITVESGGEWGALDADGGVLIDGGYRYISPYSDGLAFALDGEGSALIIDKEGRAAAHLPTEVFSKGGEISTYGFNDAGFTFVVNEDGKGSVVTESGEVILAGVAAEFQYVSKNYIVYGGDLYRVIEE